jgi:hypothetical protein
VWSLLMTEAIVRIWEWGFRGRGGWREKRAA